MDFLQLNVRVDFTDFYEFGQHKASEAHEALDTNKKMAYHSHGFWNGSGSQNHAHGVKTVSQAVSPATTINQRVRSLVDSVNGSPRGLVGLHPTEAVTVFRAVLDAEPPRINTDRLEHLLRCAVNSGCPQCLNELVAWTQARRQIPALTTVSFQLLGNRNGGNKLKKMLLRSECAAAAAVLSGPAH